MIRIEAHLKLMTRVLVAMAVIIAHHSPFLATAAAQYDGSFDEIYFQRTFSPKSEALGRTGVAVSDNALSLQTNSALIGFMDGVFLTHSHSSPFYGAPKGHHEFIGMAGIIGSKLALGMSNAAFQMEFQDIIEFSTELLTLAVVAKPTDHIALSVNGRRVSATVRNTQQVGKALYDHEQWYIDLNAAFRHSYNPRFANSAELMVGVTYQNALRNEWSPPKLIEDINTTIPLPVILTAGLAHGLRWGSKNYLSLTLFGEYQNVLNSDYLERFSAGSELDFSGFLKGRVGYFTQSNDDGGLEENKDEITEMTYGFGVVLPISQLVGPSNAIRLEFDYARMQQPLFTHNNIFSVGEFTMLSATLRVEL
jgi:hypothetical protein